MAKASKYPQIRLDVTQEADIELSASEHFFTARIQIDGKVVRMTCSLSEAWFFDGNWERNGYDYTVDEMFSAIKGENDKIALTFQRT